MQWTWVWVGSSSWWWTGKPGMLQPTGPRESDTTEQLNWSVFEGTKQSRFSRIEVLTYLLIFFLNRHLSQSLIPWWLRWWRIACSAGDLGKTPGLGRTPGGWHGNPLQYSCLENPHGQSSVAGYSPWGRKESDMTEWLHIVHTSQNSSCSVSLKIFLHTDSLVQGPSFFTWMSH